MATDADFMRYVTEQLRGVTGVTVRKMFGEYAVYVNARVVALVCDNRLFVKPTAGGRALLDPVVEAAPYPGAKLYFALDDVLDACALAIVANRRRLGVACCLPRAIPARDAKGLRMEIWCG